MGARRYLLLSCAALILVSGCGGRTGLGNDWSSAGAGGADALSRGPERNDGLPPGCLEEDLVVHLLSDRQVVYSFDPVAITVERVGQFDCGARGLLAAAGGSATDDRRAAPGSIRIVLDNRAGIS